MKHHQCETGLLISKIDTRSEAASTTSFVSFVSTQLNIADRRRGRSRRRQGIAGVRRVTRILSLYSNGSKNQKSQKHHRDKASTFQLKQKAHNDQHHNTPYKVDWDAWIPNQNASIDDDV